MSAVYSPAGHPLLSQEAAGLDSDVLDAHAVIAERVLGLRGVDFTGDAADEAISYVARQVNLQVRIEKRGGSDVVSESKGSQSYTYAQIDGRRVAIDAVAKAGADALLNGGVPRFSGSTPIAFSW